MQTNKPDTSIPIIQFVLFGALGDLAWRLVVPALFNLFVDRRLPKKFHLIGVDREIVQQALADRLRDGVAHFSRRGAPADGDWSEFTRCLSAAAIDLSDRSAYTVLADALQGDATLFMRSDQVQAAWELLMPIIETWASNPAPDFPNYAAGSWGPEAAEHLIASDGRTWLAPSQWHPNAKRGAGSDDER